VSTRDFFQKQILNCLNYSVSMYKHKTHDMNVTAGLGQVNVMTSIRQYCSYCAAFNHSVWKKLPVWLGLVCWES